MPVVIHSRINHDERVKLLTPAWTPLRPHPIQQAYYFSKKRFPCAVAGRRSGKTELSRRRIIRDLAEKKPWYDPKFFYALPTRDQAKKVAWQKLKDLIPSDWIDRIYESDLIIKTRFNSELHVVGMDVPQRIEGIPWDGGVLDESSDQKPKVFSLSIRPALSDRGGYCRRIGVPKRAGIGAGEFKDFCESTRDDPDVGYYTWKSEDILPKEEIEAAKRQLSREDYDEQYGANWQNAAGAIFSSFLDEFDISELRGNISHQAQYNPREPIGVGMDFNVNPMAWTLNHVRNGVIYTFDEIWLRNINTRGTLDYLVNSQYGQHTNGWVFFGDATSRARKTAAAASDYIQIVNDTRFRNARIEIPQSNPSREDRFASANAKLCNAAGDRSWLINPRCVNLRKDLNNRHYHEGTREPEDKGDLGHITDAATYLVHYMFPLRAAQEGSTGVAVRHG